MRTIFGVCIAVVLTSLLCLLVAQPFKLWCFQQVIQKVLKMWLRQKHYSKREFLTLQLSRNLIGLLGTIVFLSILAQPRKVNAAYKLLQSYLHLQEIYLS